MKSVVNAIQSPNAGRIAICLLSLGLVGSIQAAEINLRILETTDLHMNLLSYDYYQDKPTDQYGLARTITLIKAARAEAPNNLLIDNGDLLQGNPLGDVMAKIKPLKDGDIHPAYKVMNAIGYDAANIGNHEFNYGLDFLRRAIKGANFPYVNANVFIDDAAKGSDKPTHAFTPYVILERKLVDKDGKAHNLKIGVIGFVPPQIAQWDRSQLNGRVVVRDIAQMAERYVPEMRAKGAHLVIAVPHSGLGRADAEPMAENSVARLAQIPGIDALLFGHSHAEFPSKSYASFPKADIERGTINGVPAVMPGRWGDHLGLIDLKLDNASGNWKVVTSQAQIRPIYDRVNRKPLAEPDPMVQALVGTEHAATLEYTRNRVANTSAPIYSYFAQVQDDPSVQIVANAQIAYVQRALVGTPHENLPVLSAAAPFKTGGRQGWGYYTDIAAGPLAIKDVADLYIYPNTLKAILLTGAEVKEWLEMSAGQFNQIKPVAAGGAAQQTLINESFPSFNFDTLDGVSYEFDLTQPAKYATNGNLASAASSRVVNLRFKGQPIDLAAKFVVATNNYRAYGGGNFPGLVAEKVILDAPEENRQALVEYLTLSDALQPGKGVNPTADGNWRIAPVSGVKLTFTGASTAVKYLANHPSISLLKDNADGSALYTLGQ